MSRLGPVAVLLLAACAAPEELSTEELLDPETCASCHPAATSQWQGSMHAYASEDPVFRAMNEVAQREAGLGDFCVQCHAPVALALGETTDGLNLDELPASRQGITCAWCHQIDAVVGTHNAALSFANDGLLRGPIPDPSADSPHRSAYSSLHDRNHEDSSAMCGACHDVRTPIGVHLERTFEEWQLSLFSEPGPGRQSCGHCHMRTTGQEPTLGIQGRDQHDHSMPAVDVPLTPFPNEELTRDQVQAELDRALLAELCVLPITAGVEITLRLEGAAVGHHFPSGASHDRRVWAELVVLQDGEVVHEDGLVADGQPVEEVQPLVQLHDRALTADGELAHQFWEVVRIEERTLPAATTTDPLDPAFDHGRQWSIPLPGLQPDEVQLRVRMRPIGLDVLDDLVASGDLEPTIREAMPTFDLQSTELLWQGPIGSCVQ